MRVVEPTMIKFGSFHNAKNEMVEPVCEQLYRWKQNGLGIEVIRCDNAGENKLLQQRCNSKDWKLNIEFEFTARDTPQQNHQAEIAITNINNQGRALLHRANIPNEYKNKIFKEAWKTAIDLDGLVVITIDGKKMTR